MIDILSISCETAHKASLKLVNIGSGNALISMVV